MSWYVAGSINGWKGQVKFLNETTFEYYPHWPSDRGKTGGVAPAGTIAAWLASHYMKVAIDPDLRMDEGL